MPVPLVGLDSSPDSAKVVLILLLLLSSQHDPPADADEDNDDWHHDGADDAPCRAEGTRGVFLLACGDMWLKLIS